MWQLKKLGEVAYLSGRIGWKGLTAKEYTKEGPLFLSVHGLNYGDYVDFRDAFHISQERYDESPEIMLRDADILICKDGAGIGKLGIIKKLPSPATINSSLLLIRANHGIEPKFLYYALCSPLFQRVVQERIDGATTPHLYQREIRELEIPIPPISQQKRIVTILDKAFAGIDKAIANNNKVFGNARELFDNKLDADFNALAGEHGTVELGSLIDISHGFSFKGADFSTCADPVLPIVLTPGNYTENAKLIFTEANTKRLSTKPLPNFIFKKDDLTVVMTDLSSKMKILGKPAFIEDSNILHNQRIGRVIFNNGTLVRRYLYYFLRTLSVQEHIRATATGTMVRHTAPKRILSMQIPYPLGRESQTSLAKKFDQIADAVEGLTNIAEKKSAALLDLKQSLLAQAFNGGFSAASSDVSEAAE